MSCLLAAPGFFRPASRSALRVHLLCARKPHAKKRYASYPTATGAGYICAGVMQALVVSNDLQNHGLGMLAQTA